MFGYEETTKKEKKEMEVCLIISHAVFFAIGFFVAKRIYGGKKKQKYIPYEGSRLWFSTAIDNNGYKKNNSRMRIS